MKENIIITATVNGTTRTWSVKPEDAKEISNHLAATGDTHENPAVSNAAYIFSTVGHSHRIDNLDGTL